MTEELRKLRESTGVITGKPSISARRLHEFDSLKSRALHRNNGRLYEAVFAAATNRWYLNGNYEVEAGA